MVTENKLFVIPGKAAEDLSSDQYRGLVRDKTSGKLRRPNSKIERPEGVLQGVPAAVDREASLMVDGYTKMVAGGVLALGDRVVAEYVSAADAGKAIKSEAGYHYVLGEVTEVLGTIAEGEMVQVHLGIERAFEFFTAHLPDFIANDTEEVGIFVVQRAIRIMALSVACVVLPADADGTCLLNVLNYDLSVTTDDALISAAVDMEGLTAKTSLDLTVTTTAADLTLADGDFIHVTLVNNSAAIDTQWEGAALTIEYELL